MKARRADRLDRRNRASLRTVLGVGAALLLASGLYLWMIGAGNRADAIGGPFDLVAGDGQKVTERSFTGKYLLIYFGYTSCEDVCPMTLTTVAAALADLGSAADRVQPLFITVDPERDTPQVMVRYAAAFTPRLTALSGTPEALRRVATEYRVASSRRPGEGDMIDHSSVLYLIAPGGRYLAPIRADLLPAEMARNIAAHLS